jgi:hypothetical protein
MRDVMIDKQNLCCTRHERRLPMAGAKKELVESPAQPGWVTRNSHPPSDAARQADHAAASAGSNGTSRNRSSVHVSPRVTLRGRNQSLAIR